jgi:thiol-disulfide isomerase/thioredoxin
MIAAGRRVRVMPQLKVEQGIQAARTSRRRECSRRRAVVGSPGKPIDLRLSRRRALAVGGSALGISGLLLAVDDSEAAPRFSAKTLTGESFNNQSLLGKVVLLEFWATWCPYWSDAEPLDDLAKEFEKDGLVVLAVDVAESKKTVKAFLERNPRKAKVVLMEDTNLAAMFAAKSFPLYVLINREGHVVGQQSGAGGEAALRRILRKAGLESGRDDDAPVELRSSPRRGF